MEFDGMSTKIEELKNWIIQTTQIRVIVDYADLYKDFVVKRD